MRFTGKLKEPIIDFVTHRLTILFEPNEDFLEAYEELKGKEVLSLEIKPYRMLMLTTGYYSPSLQR